MRDFYLVTLATSIDDLPIGAFETLSGVRAVIQSNPFPDGNGDWPPAVQNALDVAERDLSQHGPLLWLVWRVVGGVPVDMESVELDGSDLHSLFVGPTPETPEGCPQTLRLYEAPQEEWDSTGCGPVG